MHSSPALPARYGKHSGEAGGIKNSDGKLLYFIDDLSTIQDKAKPFLVFYTEDRCMEVCKNKASGKYFLFIEETNDGKLLLVIPNGEIKELDSSLFEDIEELDIEYCLNTGLIVKQQIDGYKKFVKKEPILPHDKT
jgi:hypothetical protein